MHFLEQIDFCYSIVGLSYKGHKRYKSWFGGIVSISLFFSFIGIICYYLISFISREIPKMTFEDMKYWSAPENDVSKNFTMAIMMKFNGINQFRNDLIKLSAYYYNNTESKSTQKIIDFIQCDSNLFINNQNEFLKLELSKAKCLNLTGISIQGSSVNDIFQYIQIKFLLCLQGEDCYPLSDQETVFQELKPIAYIYFLDTAFQTNSKTNKVVHFINYIEVNVTHKNSKETQIYFSKNEMRVDESYFFSSSPKVFSFFMLDSFRDLVSVRTEEQDEALKLNILSSKNKSVINISYMQLSELLANIAAISNVITFMLTGLGNYANHYFFQNDLMNSLFIFDKGKQLDTQKNVKTTTEVKSYSDTKLKTQNSIKIFREPHQQNSSSSISRSEKEIFKKQHHNLKKEKEFTKLEILCFAIPISICKCKNFKQRKRKFSALDRKIFDLQDMIKVFNKLREVDIIKYLIFSARQLKLYNNIPKQIVPLHNLEGKVIANKHPFFSFQSMKKKKDFTNNEANPNSASLFKPANFTGNENEKGNNDIDARLITVLNEGIEII